jgi:hypothetical protein
MKLWVTSLMKGFVSTIELQVSAKKEAKFSLQSFLFFGLLLAFSPIFTPHVAMFHEH